MKKNILELLEVPVGKLHKYFKKKEIGDKVRPPIILRLDGVKFSNLPPHFTRPRDERVHRALVKAAIEVVKRYSYEAAYIVSDEINIFMLRQLPYNGRVEKLNSITASIISAYTSHILKLPLFFDCRVVKIESIDEAVQYLLYRARVGLGNYIGCLLKQLGLSPRKPPYLKQQIKMLKDRGIDIGNEPLWKILGSSIVWSNYEKIGYDPINKREVKVIRRRITVEEGYEKLLKYLESLR